VIWVGAFVADSLWAIRFDSELTTSMTVTQVFGRAAVQAHVKELGEEVMVVC
jgi:hypothetical protein